jgi:transcriptional regulator with XRE-family HTH domain
MDDQQVGMAIRTVRIRRRKRQKDIATEARISASTVSRIERGRLDEVAVGTLRRVCARLELRVDIRVRSRGGDLDRMVSARHARLVELIVARLRLDTPGWEVVPEVSFSIWGERGVIDIFAWHAGRRALLVIEVKTEFVDVGETLGTLDRKRRLAREIALLRGWDPETVSAWLVVAEGRTNERRIAGHRETLRAAYPDDGRRMRAWLAQPEGSVAALSTWREDAKSTAPIHRVRVARRRVSSNTTVPANADKSTKRSPGDS